MRQTVRNDIGAFASPEFIQNATGLPKTRSGLLRMDAGCCFFASSPQSHLLQSAANSAGKIMRRVLRKIATKSEHELGDLSTLAEPGVIEV